ncbi:hypothetical protein HOK51_04360 [Candidatus Woesearchaeota archaeon]|jgi:hypothetical protein|nr:hypothetical protein [Candidatus Woesearchaeota archaeon]MBT6519056.1 hypothetical protein [Candidatus Woesearchaeota archaeon]MBT7367325.1 hypothetical protein [Candidatus Woesearchaeota archaeon]
MSQWLIISIFVVILILLVVFFAFNKGKKFKPDYHALFTIGIVWFVIGIPLKNYSLIAIGFIFLLVGFVNKNKWKENRQSWDKLSSEEKKLRMGIMIGLGVLLLIGLFVFFLKRFGLF